MLRRHRNRRSNDDWSLTLPSAGGEIWHRTPAEVLDPLRRMVGRWQLEQKVGVEPVMAVTSTLGGEGVTFVARSLAHILAHDLDRSVCLVDLNWWSPSDRPSGTDGPGLAEVIFDDVDIDRALHPLGDDRVTYLGTGSPRRIDRPVLAQSERLGEEVAELESCFDHVILDLPAMHRAGEALSLTTLAPTCLVVVRHGVTTVDQVRATLDSLSAVPVVGVVLNRARSSVPRFVADRLPQG